MRTFDYKRLPQQLFGGPVSEANVKVHEDKGKLDVLRQLHPDAFEALRSQAHFDNVDASTHIEGLYAEGNRARAVVNGSAPSDETEAQIAGYSNALRLVESHATDLDLSTSTILKLYETLYAHRDLGRKSRYRKKDYLYVQVDGHPQAMPVSPITAFETPLVLGGACDCLSDAFESQAASPLILNAVFTVDFLCIRPFDEGNGRIVRLFAELMLAKSGFDVAQFVSVDRIFEATAMDYYDALNACVERWDRAQNDYTPYVLYWLHVLHEAHRQLFEKIDIATNAATGKSERVREFVQRAQDPVAKRHIREALPDISEATIEAALGSMVKEGLVEKVGKGRSTAYRWL